MARALLFVYCLFCSRAVEGGRYRLQCHELICSLQRVGESTALSHDSQIGQCLAGQPCELVRLVSLGKLAGTFLGTSKAFDQTPDVLASHWLLHPAHTAGTVVLPQPSSAQIMPFPLEQQIRTCFAPLCETCCYVQNGTSGLYLEETLQRTCGSHFGSSSPHVIVY